MDVSVIIVNWNTRELLQNCINSIYQTVSGITCEIIVVDNGSCDGSVEMLQEKFPQVHVIKNTENRGFGAANNQGLRSMKGRYALLLNSDAVLKGNAVRELFSFMEAHPEAGMACGQLLHADGRKQNSIAPFPSLLTLLTNVALLEYILPKRFPSKRYARKEPIEIDSGIGACLLVSRKAIDEVGLFDERYFFFFEETDWAYQMRSAGWKIFHVPSALIYHLQGQSIGGDSRFRVEFYRSRYQFFRKWRKLPSYIVISSVIILRLLVNWLFTGAANVFTLGVHRKMRDKWLLYSQLILWHIKGCPLIDDRRN